MKHQVISDLGECYPAVPLQLHHYVMCANSPLPCSLFPAVFTVYLQCSIDTVQDRILVQPHWNPAIFVLLQYNTNISVLFPRALLFARVLLFSGCFSGGCYPAALFEMLHCAVFVSVSVFVLCCICTISIIYCNTLYCNIHNNTGNGTYWMDISL